MAKECDKLRAELTFHRKKSEELEDVSVDAGFLLLKELTRVGHIFLSNLEKVDAENAISAQLRPLFLEACDVIPSHVKNESSWTNDTSSMISDVSKIIKPEKIAEIIKASKPSSSPITMEKVRFVSAILGWCHGMMYMFQLKMKLSYLEGLLVLSAQRCIEHESVKDLFIHVEDIAYTATQLCFLKVAHNIDSEFSELLERINSSRQIYLSVLIETKSSSGSKAQTALEYPRIFVDSLIVDLRELLSNDASLKAAFDDRIPWLQQGLSDLSGFLWDIRRCSHVEEFTSLKSHMEALAIEVATVIYSYRYDDETGIKTDEINHVTFHLRLAFNLVKVEVDLIQLLCRTKDGIAAPLKDLINYVQEELVFLRSFIFHALQQCKEKSEITVFSTLVQSLTIQAFSRIENIAFDSEREDCTAEISHLHFKLLLRYKFVKAVIRQMFPDISASSTLDHPMLNLLDFLPINFEAIDSYLSKIKHSSSVDMVLMGFPEYILDELQLKCETNWKTYGLSELKKLYYGLLLLVTYLVDPLAQSTGCKMQNSLLTGFGTIGIKAYEDVACSNKSRKADLVLQFLIESFKLVEKGERVMDLPIGNAMSAEILNMIKKALKELIFLIAFFMDILRQHTELSEVNDLLIHAEMTAHKMSKFRGYVDLRLLEVRERRRPLSDYLQGIKSIEVEVKKVCFQLLDASPCRMTDGEGLIDFLLNHQNWMLSYDACSISSLKNEILLVKDKLVCLGSFLADIVQYRHMQQELKEVWTRIQDMKYVCFFTIRGNRPAWYYMLYLSDVNELLRFVEAEVETICLKTPDSSSYSFPETNGLGFLNCILGKLEELLCSQFNSIYDPTSQIGSVKDGLLCLRSSIDHFAKSYQEHDEVHTLITSVSEMAYKAEYIIDSCLTSSHPLWYKTLWISEVVESIKLVNKVVNETYERKKIDVMVPQVATISTNLSPSLSANTPRENEKMEGFQDAMDELKKQLLEGARQLDLVSIIGMPGLGKTTLATKVYNDPIVISHFDVRAQCRVTQVYSWRELLLTVLNGILEPADRNEKEDGELADELRQFLLTKRFLILIDDVWDNKVWDNFYMCFKDGRNGSRVILTTRLSDVANYAKCESLPHHLRLFRDDESWTLLQKEVFQEESCPPELVDVGSRIAKRCRGLPLSIVLVAGVLKQKKKKADLWGAVEESLGSKSIGCLEESMSIIGFSYKNLPENLKPCFLYFGGFLKGKDIQVSRLTRFWQAEQFVQANEEKGPEDAAYDFLKDLVHRNLVMGMEKRPNGKMKTCGIHDLLHTFCLEKAKQENFLLQINSVEDVFPKEPKEYRLFVHSYQDEIDLWRPSRSNVRSLLFNSIDPDSLSWPRDVSFIFDNFKLVKVLDLESFNIGGTFPSAIQSLVQLRYFASQTDANSIPSSIEKLCNLETLVVRGLGGEMRLPSSLLTMVKLRHVHIDHRASFGYEFPTNSQLANLETFSTPHLSYGEGAETLLRLMPDLRKLSCIFSGTFGSSARTVGRCVLFPRLEFLSRLESLKLVSNSYPAKLPHEYNFPLQLRELTLSKFRLPWTQISTIAELPNLEILKLCLRAFEGDHWEVKDSEFPELKYLQLDNLKVAQWSVSDDAFPRLERLILTKCKQLEKIPSHFDGAVSLRSIQVKWCSWSVANSAWRIQTTQREEMANDAFTVAIQPPDWARSSSP